MKHPIVRFAAAVLVCALVRPAPSWADGNTATTSLMYAMAYDGYVVLDGVPLDAPTGAPMRFSLTSSPTCGLAEGGCIVFAQTRDVPVHDGRFSVMIGAAPGARDEAGSLSIALRDGEARYLVIEVDGVDLGGRQLIEPTAWSNWTWGADTMSVNGELAIGGGLNVTGSLGVGGNVEVSNSLAALGDVRLPGLITSVTNYTRTTPGESGVYVIGSPIGRACFLGGFRYGYGGATEAGFCRVFFDGANYVMQLGIEGLGADVQLQCTATCITWN